MKCVLVCTGAQHLCVVYTYTVYYIYVHYVCVMYLYIICHVKPTHKAFSYIMRQRWCVSVFFPPCYSRTEVYKYAHINAGICVLCVCAHAFRVRWTGVCVYVLPLRLIFPYGNESKRLCKQVAHAHAKHQRQQLTDLVAWPWPGKQRKLAATCGR